MIAPVLPRESPLLDGCYYIAGLIVVSAVVIVGALAAGVGQRGFDLGDLGGGQVEKAIDDFVDVPLDPRDGGSVGGGLGGTFRELRELSLVGSFAPTGQRRSALGCEVRATLGHDSRDSSIPTGLPRRRRVLRQPFQGRKCLGRMTQGSLADTATLG